MSNHVTEWLNAYLDGELKGGRLHQVEEHLLECQECQAELQSLKSLAAMLHEVSTPEFTSTERFAAQVNLQLPHRLSKPSKHRVQEIGWWMIPASLLMLWIFISTSATVSNVISTANELGMLGNVPAWLVPAPSSGAFWADTLGEFGLLGGPNLTRAEMVEAFTRNTLHPFIWHISIALLYLGWIAIWWARQKRQEHDQLPEG